MNRRSKFRISASSLTRRIVDLNTEEAREGSAPAVDHSELFAIKVRPNRYVYFILGKRIYELSNSKSGRSRFYRKGTYYDRLHSINRSGLRPDGCPKYFVAKSDVFETCIDHHLSYLTLCKSLFAGYRTCQGRRSSLRKNCCFYIATEETNQPSFRAFLVA